MLGIGRMDDINVGLSGRQALASACDTGMKRKTTKNRNECVREGVSEKVKITSLGVQRSCFLSEAEDVRPVRNTLIATPTVSCTAYADHGAHDHTREKLQETPNKNIHILLRVPWERK